MSLNPSDRAGDLVAGQSAVSAHSPGQQRSHLAMLAIMVALLASPFPVLRALTYTGSADLRAVTEMAGALFGLLAGFALIARFYVPRSRLHLLAGLAFSVSGAGDFVHGLLSLGVERGWAGWAGASLERLVPDTYAGGRLLFGLILLGAPLLSRQLGRSADPKRGAVRASLFVLLLAAAATAVAFLVPLPHRVFPARVISRPVDFVSALVLAGALFAFVREYRHRGEGMVWWVTLSIGISMVGQGMMSFSKGLYDPLFDVAHVYKVLGYATPLLGLCLYQISLLGERAAAQQDLRRQRDLLEELARRRTDELEASNRQLRLEAAELARAADAVRASEEKYRGIVENVQVGIALISPDMEILELNRTMREWFPHVREGEKRICYQSHDWRARSEPYPHCPTIETLRDGQVHEAVREATAGQEVHYHRIVSSAIRDAAGEVTGAIEIVEDVTERERSVRSLEESEARYRALVEDMPALICRFAPDGTLAFVNDAYCEYFGRTREELVGGHFSEFISEEDRQRVREHFGSLSADNPVESHEQSVVTPGGSVRHQRWTNRLICDAAGRPVEFQSVGMDITDRRKAEETLRESEGKLNAVLESILDHVTMVDRDLNIVWANEAVKTTFGQDVVGRKCYRVYRGRSEPREPHPCIALRVFADGRPHEDETEAVDKTGRTCYFHCRANVALRDGDGTPTAVVEISRDVTRQKLAEQELRQSQQKYYHLFHNLNNAAFLADIETGELLDANKQAEVLLGRTRDEIIGMHQSELHPPGEADRYRAMFERHIAQRHAADFDADVCGKDGGIVPVRVSASLLNVGGRDCLLGLFHDLTEGKRAEAERRRLEARVREAQKLESMGVLAGGIAHDFNNLLTSVIGNAGLALMDLSADLPVRHSIEQINAAARRAAELANQMLAYSGKGQFVLEPIDLSDLVRKLQHLLGSAVSKRVTLEFDLAEDLPAVEGDATQLRQVVMNLVINASEAIGDCDGSVTVRTCAIDTDTSYLADSHVDDGLSSGPYVCLEVVDTGCGMDQETKERVFDPFFSTKFTGRGLGLAAVLGIVRGHGGAIRVASKPGKGSTFRALLPVCDATALELAEPQQVPEGELRGHGTVLVVDDEEAIRQLSKAALERLGFTVLTAEDGPQAIETLKAGPGRVQAVLLDLTMPHMDAEEVVRELRGLRKDLPIVLSSGYSEDEADRRFQHEELAGFIQKPYDPATLAQALLNVLPGEPAP